MIDELRTSFARQAELVRPAPDPYGRLRRRYRRRRAGRAALAGCAVAVLVSGLLLGAQALRPPGGGPNVPASPLVQALLDSPTRGSLAGDRAFLNVMLRRVTQLLAPTDLGASAQPTDSGWRKVLFAGDIPDGHRLVLIAAEGGPVRMWFGDTGTPAADLARGADQPLAPVLRVDVWDADNLNGARLLLAPAGSRLERSDAARYLADGSVDRSWRAVDGDWLAEARSDLTPQTRVRVERAGVTVFDGGFGAAAAAAVAFAIDAVPMAGRGEPEWAAAQATAHALSQQSGLDRATASFRVLWSHEFPPVQPFETTPRQVATVVALTPDGGGLYYTAAVDPTQPGVTIVGGGSGAGVIGDPDHSVIAVRVPIDTRTGELPRLEIIAPPAAVRADVVENAQLVASAPLTTGVGEMRLAELSDATILAYDDTGTLLAEMSYTDTTNLGDYPFEPDHAAW